MRKTTRTMKLLALVAGAAMVAAGCTTLSDKVADNGESAQKLVWPKTADTNVIHKGGTFPNIESLKLVQAGMTKEQIAALIGEPQFGEFVATREWDYLLNFRGANGQVTQCEYKVLFDTKRIARSFYWNPEGCAAPFLNPPAPVTPVAAPAKVVLDADALFAFDKSDLSHMQAGPRGQLDAFARQLSEPALQDKQILVVGYTDRLGSASYNQGLSLRRAQTVRNYLVSHGVAANRISVEGRGMADPVVECHQRNRSELIACLAPNRRVELSVR